MKATGLGPPEHEMAEDTYILSRSNGRRYEAVLRLSEALSLCPEHEDLTKILSEQLREFLAFLQFYIIVYKENSTEVEWAVVGREKSLVAAYADVPVEQRPSWQAYTTQEPFHIHDWSTDERVPARLKQGIAAQGLEIGPLVFVPLTTPHRRLGALGMSGRPGTVYSCEDISFFSSVPKETLDAFTLYSWPGNVQELQKLIERAVIYSDNGVLPNPLPTNANTVLTPAEGIFKDSERAASRSGTGVLPDALPLSDMNPLALTTPVVNPAEHTLKDFERALILRT